VKLLLWVFAELIKHATQVDQSQTIKVQRGDAHSFVLIAAKAGHCQVVCCRQPTQPARQDVVEGECPKRNRLARRSIHCGCQRVA
jgi:hypothetical protein